MQQYASAYPVLQVRPAEVCSERSAQRHCLNTMPTGLAAVLQVLPALCLCMHADNHHSFVVQGPSVMLATFTVVAACSTAAPTSSHHPSHCMQLVRESAAGMLGMRTSMAHMPMQARGWSCKAMLPALCCAAAMQVLPALLLGPCPQAQLHQHWLMGGFASVGQVCRCLCGISTAERAHASC